MITYDDRFTARHESVTIESVKESQPLFSAVTSTLHLAIEKWGIDAIDSAHSGCLLCLYRRTLLSIATTFSAGVSFTQITESELRSVVSPSVATAPSKAGGQPTSVGDVGAAVAIPTLPTVRQKTSITSTIDRVVILTMSHHRYIDLLSA